MDPSALKTARLQLGITKAEIARQTKLSGWAIDAIERGQFERLPSGIYARAYVRAYAEAVDLDPEMIVHELSGTLPTVDVQVADVVAVRKTDDTRDYLRLLAAAVVDAAVVLAVGAIHIVVSAAVTGVTPWEVVRAAPVALPALIVAAVVLYVGVLGATGVGTAGAWLFNVDFVPPPHAPLDGDELARRFLRYLRREVLAPFDRSVPHLQPPRA
jgi:DNA-binding XRE family transcriptional regulator